MVLIGAVKPSPPSMTQGNLCVLLAEWQSVIILPIPLDTGIDLLCAVGSTFK